jgi:glutamyl-tRNA synthetase
MLRVRFAPSPTGYLHIGGARTCLFNWLYARKMGGQFILRIEDTDLVRSKEEYLDEILESVKWLGMDWDELYYQSQRFDIYKQYATKLIDQGKAISKDGAVFFKYDLSIPVAFSDLIRGKVEFSELPKEEEVIIKSDGSPTYNFCCVIDDASMDINCVIRGEDHISNTPKQILMYRALAFKEPVFAHVPLILSPDGGRLSKRHGATAISEYRQLGYLSDAMVNYLLLLGWSPGENREIISLAEAKDMFDIKDVNSTGAAFAWDKLNWVNSEYIKKLSPQDMTTLAYQCLAQKDFLPAGTDKEYVGRVAWLFRERMPKLSELTEITRYFYYDDFTYAEDTVEILANDMSQQIAAVSDSLAKLGDFSHSAIEADFRNVCTGLGLKLKILVHPVRVAISGRRTGAGLFETMEVLGKERVLARLGRLLEYWRQKKL